MPDRVRTERRREDLPASGRRFDLVYVGPLRPALGGTQVVCTALLSRLARHGHRVRTISARSTDFVRKPIQSGLHPDVESVWFEMSHIDIFLGYQSEANPFGLDREAYVRTQSQHIRDVLGAMISERRPDLVVIGRESFLHGIPEFVHGRGVPCLLLTHGAAGAVVHGRYRDDLTRPLLNGMAEVDGIIAVAQHMGDGLRSLGLPHVTTIRNPVDVELFAPRPRNTDLRTELGIGPEDFVVYHASNLKAVKRPLDLIAAAARAVRQNRNIRFLIVGDGPLGSEMMALCRAMGIEDRVHFEGWVEYERLPAYLAAADIAVMSSETEGQPMAVLEAMACARPIVATAIPAFEELVARPGAGLLAPVGDTTAMAELILRLADNRILRQRLGAAGRAKVLSGHDLSRTVVAYETAIAAVIDRAREHPGSLTLSHPAQP
ncbi:MAG: glycosyltransferase family 4 protein [Alphaproteobacteria bacterium]|nr:glycosyltransferase family 4 protein [Alphaproteobacteria bacterium]